MRDLKTNVSRCLLVPLVAVVLLCGTGGCGGQGDGNNEQAKGNGGQSNQPPDSKKSQVGNSNGEKPIDVTCSQLLGEYDKNAAAADIKYKGKMLAVAGHIRRIDEHSVRLSHEFAFLKGIDCHFLNETKPSVAGLSNGQRVIAIGKCTGRSIPGSVTFRQCEFKVPPKLKEPIVITAELIGKGNLLSLADRYSGEVGVVSGIVERVTNKTVVFKEQCEIWLKVSEGKSIRCSFPPADVATVRTFMKGFMKGQRITVRGTIGVFGLGGCTVVR